MFQTFQLFKSSAGLNNRIDPARLAYNPESGAHELATAVNVDFDRTGRISRRKGTTRISTNRYHSLFSAGSYALAVTRTADTMVAIDKSYAVTTVATVDRGQHVSYLRIGTMVYWCNGIQRGIVTNKVNSAWEAADYVGPDTMKTFSDPPTGHLLEFFNGRVYIAHESVLWYTEPFSFSWVNLVQNFVPFTDRIRMVQAVRDGLWIGTETAIYSLRGETPANFVFTKIADYGVIEGCAIKVPGSMIGDSSAWLEHVFFLSTNGICVGGVEGRFRNVTEQRVTFTPGVRGGAYYNDGKVVFTIEY